MKTILIKLIIWIAKLIGHKYYTVNFIKTIEDASAINDITKIGDTLYFDTENEAYSYLMDNIKAGETGWINYYVDIRNDMLISITNKFKVVVK